LSYSLGVMLDSLRQRLFVMSLSYG
jgi:hypothetical protein